MYFESAGDCYRLNENLFVERCNEINNVKIPTKSKKGDAGWDFYLPQNCFYIVDPGKWRKIGLGIRTSFPEGYVLQINDRSGLASNSGLFTIGNIVDSGYTGEIHVTIVNLSDDEIIIKDEMKICQGLLLYCDTSKFEKPEKVMEYTIKNMVTERMGDGFGSTGNAK